MIDTSLFNLQCFVTVAQYLNYTKAADNMNLSQSALSRIVRNLEQEIGYDLFVRNTRSVRLTKAGEMFFEKVKTYLYEINRIVIEGAELASGSAGILRVGFSPYTYSESVVEIVDQYRKQFPQVRLSIMTGEEHDIEVALRRGEIDIALLSDWSTVFPDDYVNDVIYEDRYCAVVSVLNPLAQKDSVSMKDLENEPVILVEYENDSFSAPINYINRPLEWCVEHGFLPNVRSSGNIKTLTGLPYMIALNEGIGFLAAHMERFCANVEGKIKFLEISDVEFKFSATAVYAKNNNNVCIHDFINIAREIAPMNVEA